MVWILSGPSSAGKSTFITSEAFTDRFGVHYGEASVFMAATAPSVLPNDRNTVFHYNIMRPVRVQRSKEGKNIITMSPFSKDRPWHNLLIQKPKSIRCVVMICSQREILQRVKAREFQEDALNNGAEKLKYQTDYWAYLYGNIDLSTVYERWFSELGARKISFEMIDSTSPEYRVIDSENEALELVRR